MWNTEGCDDMILYIVLLVLIICCFATNLVNKALSRPLLVSHSSA